MKLHGENLIGSKRSSEGTSSFHGFDPSKEAPLEPRFLEGTSTEIDRAMELAGRAFKQYRKISDERRAAFLDAIAARLRDHTRAIVERAGLESGLPEARLQGEHGRTTNQLEMFATLLRDGSWVDARIDRADPARAPIPKPDVRRMTIALGPVVIFGASNFPLAFSVAGGDTASALAAGCPVVVKGHPAHPGTSELVARCILQAAEDGGMPEGVFSLLHGRGHELGLALIRHATTRAVAFTGSQGAGRALFDEAAKREVPIPVFSEMGSTNPVFILPGALAERSHDVATGLHASFTLGTGQFCTSPGIAVLPDSSDTSSFRTAVANLTRMSEAGTMLYRGILENFESGLERMTSVQGVKLLSRAEAKGEGVSARAAVLSADVKTLLEHPSLTEEVFGPSTLLVGPATRDQMIEIAETLDGHLTATILASDGELEEYDELISVLTMKVGRLIVNGFPTGVEVGPAMQHGGPYPATTDARFTSVGTAAIQRFVRPVAYQDAPDSVLPMALRDENPLGILRLVDGVPTREGIARVNVV